MEQIETTIIINENAESVWNKLMNFRSYEKWNPFITAIDGKQKLGEKLKTSIVLGGKKPQHFKPEILILSPLNEFRWKGKLYLKGLFDGEHYFKLVRISENETRFIHGEKFTGILVPLIMKMIRKDTLAGFKSMNSALKKEVES